MNEKNLNPYSAKSVEIARENGRKGGIASGVAKRKRKQLREVINEVLPMEVGDPELKAALEAYGLKPTHEVAMVVAALQRAERGDIEAARFIRDTCGEKPVAEINMGSIVERPVRSLDLSQLSDDELAALADMCDAQESLPAH